MKRFYCNFYLCLIVIITGLMCLYGCSKKSELEYYNNIDNFITGEGVVDNIIYNKGSDYIVYWLSEIDGAYQCSDFVIEGQNCFTVLGNGILDKVKLGDTITFTSATGYFGNGDFMPIVALSVGGEVILDFEEGHKNLMDLYREKGAVK